MTDNGNDQRFFATCPMGFEQLLAGELASLGIERLRPLKGRVSFEGPLEAALRACLWSRLASRVICVLGRVDATSADALYEGLSQIAWEDHVRVGATIAVDAHGTNAELRNTQFVALRTKDAVVDRLMARRGSRPVVNVAAPDLTISVRVARDHATVGIDLSGEPLFRRGYESSRSSRSPIAPVRPDYAAALLAAGGWYRCLRHDDAACAVAFPGAGTILVEAAAQALDVAPGLLRARWGFQGWSGADDGAWQRELEAARDRRDAAHGRTPSLLACETRAGAEAAARAALRGAGLDVDVTFDSPAACGSALAGRAGALAVADLSWIAEDDIASEASALSELRALGRSLTDAAPASAASADEKSGPALVALSHSAAADAALGGKPSSTLDVMVGRSPATIRTYDTSELEVSAHEATVVDRNGRQVGVPVFLPTSEQFARRLAKVWRQRRKWAQREDVTCFRIYDADLPDYAVSIDLFQESELAGGASARGRWLQIYEYAAPREIDAALARERLLDVLAIAPRVLDVKPEDTFVKVRTRSRGGSQYADEAERGARGRRGREERGGRGRDARGSRGARGGQPALPAGAHLVDEGGLTFEVNFSRRLDCGIFLDHRDARSMVREMMKQTQGSKRFLNLFSYTGTATCYAADGGAKHTTTVDLSRPSLEWAQRNMERNGFANRGRERPHEYVQADVVSWVSEQRHTKNRWDLIFCDVPTFSNSSRMRKGSWDVQRDHAELIIGISRLLTRGGSAIFSCNLRTFRPDTETLAKAGVELEDVTAQTIGEDFSRNAKIHHAYIVRRVR